MTRILLVDDQALVRAGFETILGSEPGFEVVGQAKDGADAVRLAAELRPDVICMDVQMPVMDGLEATRAICAADDHAAVLILTTFDRDDFLFDALSAGAAGFLLKTAEPEQLIDAVHALARGDALLSPEVTRRVIERFTAAASPAGRADTPLAGRVGAEGAAPPAGRVGAEGAVSRPAAPGPAGRGAAEGGVPPVGRGAAEGGVPPVGRGAAEGGVTRPEASAPSPQLTDREHETLLLLAKGHSNAEIAARLFVGEATVKTHVSNVLLKLGVRDRIHAVIWAYEHGVIAPQR
ncbi:response regulator [Agrococcus carbonis]|uniref:Regulatory protein, luxR family n=1 Tax=Agrococcus carbonis TaxID=684552 RepID=A0A1H1NMA0_9MICO|nr:response regulator [Agrococcus carbonis]SDS00013.1 regulatory protein, luxR family [Agrococcus carbonis]